MVQTAYADVDKCKRFSVQLVLQSTCSESRKPLIVLSLDDMARNQTFAGRQQALEHRFNDFQRKLDTTLYGYEQKMVDLHSEIHEDFATRIDVIKQEIDSVWKARLDKLGIFAEELACKISDKISLLECRSVRAVNAAKDLSDLTKRAVEDAIRQADSKTKNLSDLTRRADVATDALRSQLLDVERLRSCGTSAPVPQAPDSAPSPFARDPSAMLLTCPRARQRHYSPADEKVMLAHVKASERACRDESRPPSERHAAKGALRDGLHFLEDCIRGRSPARVPFAPPSGEEASSDAALAQMMHAAITLSQLETSGH